MTICDGKIMDTYRLLFKHFGPQGWWPAEDKLEIILGAILTQAVAWKNVEKALDVLKANHKMSITAILETPQDELAELIRPALYHRQKARKLIIMMDFIEKNYHSDLELMFKEPLPKLRQDLLSLWGIGEETADSILLYAGNYPIFVVDTYTCRIFSRLGLVPQKISYSKMQGYLMDNLPAQVALYNEYHALLVALGANYCRKTNPLCSQCPLILICNYHEIMQEKTEGSRTNVILGSGEGVHV